MKTLLTSTVAMIVALTASSLALANGKGSTGRSSTGSVHSTGKTTNFSSFKGTQTTINKNVGSKYVNNKYSTTKYTKNDYHLKYGKKFDKGYCYPGKHHNHWDFCCFNKGYGCYLYYCPCTFGWYYYCEPDCCYYPVTYVPYRCYFWTKPVCYCSAPCPPVEIAIPAPCNVIGPTE